MKDWLVVNWRVLARLVSVVGLYVLVKFFPDASAEKETIEAITEVLGLGILALMPGLRAAKRETDK